jgi:hypothetical protein
MARMFSAKWTVTAAALATLAGCAGQGRNYVFSWSDAGRERTTAVRAPDILPTIRQGVYGRVLHKPDYVESIWSWAAGLTVHAHPISADGTRPGRPITAQTDENGFYEIDLPPGDYYVSPNDIRALVGSIDFVIQSGTPVQKVHVAPGQTVEFNFRSSFRP